MRSPSRAGWWALAAAAVIWTGALLGLRFGFAVAVVCAVVAAVVAFRWPAASVLIVLLIAGALSGNPRGRSDRRDPGSRYSDWADRVRRCCGRRRRTPKAGRCGPGGSPRCRRVEAVGWARHRCRTRRWRRPWSPVSAFESSARREAFPAESVEIRSRDGSRSRTLKCSGPAAARCSPSATQFVTAFDRCSISADAPRLWSPDS